MDNLLITSEINTGNQTVQQGSSTNVDVQSKYSFPTWLVILIGVLIVFKK